MINTNNKFNKPFSKFFDERETGGGMQLMQLRDKDHTPWTKRPGSVDSLLCVEVSRFMPNAHNKTSGDYVGINFEEITTTTNYNTSEKRTAGRTIAHQFPMMEALKLASFILEAAAVGSDEARAEAARIVANLNVVQHADDGQ